MIHQTSKTTQIMNTTASKTTKYAPAYIIDGEKVVIPNHKTYNSYSVATYQAHRWVNANINPEQARKIPTTAVPVTE